jgi:ribonuclease Z
MAPLTFDTISSIGVSLLQLYGQTRTGLTKLSFCKEGSGMSITFRVLGQPGRDNALLLQIDSGQAVEYLLFDCGDGCLSELSLAEVQAIDHLFFSHLHMDHVGGFDSFFRCTFDRVTTPNQVWGPPGTARILQHRFQGFLWNLHEQKEATWRVTDVHPREIHTVRFELREAFEERHDEGARQYDRIIWDEAGYTVEVVVLEHGTPSLGYIVREKPRCNIDTARLSALGLRPGPWLKQLKDSSSRPDNLIIDGEMRSTDQLRSELLIETIGESVAYLTDFALDEPAINRLADTLSGCRTLVCEASYREADLELARKNFHMTTVLAATLARRAHVGQLVLFHLSSRYTREDWIEMLQEATTMFPETHLPTHWDLETGACSCTDKGTAMKEIPR